MTIKWGWISEKLISEFIIIMDCYTLQMYLDICEFIEILFLPITEHGWRCGSRFHEYAYSMSPGNCV